MARSDPITSVENSDPIRVLLPWHWIFLKWITIGMIAIIIRSRNVDDITPLQDSYNSQSRAERKRIVGSLVRTGPAGRGVRAALAGREENFTERCCCSSCIVREAVYRSKNITITHAPAY